SDRPFGANDRMNFVAFCLTFRGPTVACLPILRAAADGQRLAIYHPKQPRLLWGHDAVFQRVQQGNDRWRTQTPRHRCRRGKRPAAPVNWPMLLSACPGHRPIMNHRPVVHLNNLQVAEIASPSPPGLVKSRYASDNRLPQLVFHSILLLVELQEIWWTPTAFYAKSLRKPFAIKLPMSAAVTDLRLTTQ